MCKGMSHVRLAISVSTMLPRQLFHMPKQIIAAKQEAEENQRALVEENKALRDQMGELEGVCKARELDLDQREVWMFCCAVYCR